jgi:hypothetical protein
VAGSRAKSRGRRRSRKRRPPQGPPDVTGLAEAGDDRAGASEAGNGTVGATAGEVGWAAEKKTKKGAPRARAHARAGSDFRDPLSVGERPPSPWHPWPLSELLILVGAVGTIVGLRRLSGGGGISSGGPALFAGLGAVALGTFEVTLREHRAGYRSHTLLLSLLPVLVFDTAVVLLVSAFTTVPRIFNVGLLAVDVALFAFLFKLWRARFLDARSRVISRR